MSPAITFAIPYYRGRDYLVEAIESVRAQSADDWELVVVDDAGPEQADDLISVYDDPRMRYVRHAQNVGMTRNWNACLSLARSPLVTLLHQDDRLLPRYAERVLEAARRYPGAAAYFTDVRVIGAAGDAGTSAADLAKKLARRPRHDYALAGDAGLSAILANNYIYCPALCLNRAVVGPDPFDPRWLMVQDLDFTTRQILADRALVSVREVLFEYRRHVGNQTEAYTLDSSRFREEVELYRSLAFAAHERGWNRSERSARRRWMLRGHLVQKALVDLVERRGRGARHKLALLIADLRGRPIAEGASRREG
ncbi:glycosyltransferase [Nocardioides sp. InS609-2]|uniref:glycosyltransferase family 2 protein n=1 Tax=Nocardioides sp. InS609-2 TaxID=2760705 RepID=UPI0020BDE059|nr:glycosyltransferase [Nocardioides sp. InS609-2]